MKNTNFSNAANAITTTVINTVRGELKDDRDRVFQRLDETETSILNALTASSGSASTNTSDADDDTSISGLTQKANATKSDAVQLEILKILQQIKGDIRFGDSGGQQKRKKGKRRLDTSKYCWSCGAWNHLGKDCFRKKPGHKDDATFANKMGGSTYYCRKQQE